MASTTTTRLALFKATPGTGEPFRTTDVNANLDILDEAGIWQKGSDVASAAGITLAAPDNFFDVTGTTSITSISARAAGTVVVLQFDGILTVTDNANINLKGNFLTSAGSTLTLISDGTNWWEVARSNPSAPSVVTLDRDVAEAAVTNTTTETTVYSYSVLGGTLSTNRALRITLIGDWINNTGGAAASVNLRVKFGGTLIGWFLPTGAANAGRYPIRLQGVLSAANATNAQRFVATMDMGQPGDIGSPPGQAAENYTESGASGNNGLALDSTAARTLLISAENSAADANISFRCFSVLLELL